MPAPSDPWTPPPAPPTPNEHDRIRPARPKAWVYEAYLQAVRDAGYTEGEIVELIGTVVINIFTNYFNHIAQTDVDFPKVAVGAPAA